jgi:uncharacterized protein (TIGR03437 family)
MSECVQFISLLTLATVWSAVAQAQAWDISGNGLLKGNYNFRQVALRVTDRAGNIGQNLALYGAVSFDGNGSYTMTGMAVDSTSPQPQPFTTRGSYSIAASGYGFLSSPVSEGDFVYGLVSNGVFVGSSTENGFYNDLLVAVTTAASPSNSTLQGSYVAAYMNMAGSTPQLQYDAQVKLSPDGQGRLGTLALTTYQGAMTPVNLTQSGVTYAFSNGVGIASFPATVNLGISGQQLWYVSPDGNFFVGGSATGCDLILGVRTGTTGSAPGLAGLYYQGGLDRDESQLSVQGYATLDSYYGSLVALADGTIIAHARLVSTFDGLVRDYTYRDTYPPNAGGEYTDSSTSTQYAISRDGGVRIGLGIGPFLGISIAVRAPVFSGPGVYLNPVGLQNSASSAPFTASIARGELILLNGTNLANNLFISLDSPFLTTLAGVQVLINNVPAPIYFIAPQYISAIVPYEVTSGVAQIQVVNNGVSSNVITAFVGKTAPGVFTDPAGGIGRAIVQHLDYSLVTANNPAHAGETLLGYLTGTGDVMPAISDGAAGPTDPLSQTTETVQIRVDKLPATVLFSGLAPTLSGLYATVFTVPNGVHSGDLSLEIAGSDASTSEALLPVAATASANSKPQFNARPWPLR